ncbi:Protein CBG24171 [Caenorhabditis briggsae]|uniref:Protein CBG24171 n=1 Tax=Caenorhabditis briggsae TaxID=6238 RepID=A8WK47_CAEBR|nr:Protein CBG24171 [Caenorhabditis briggsae]CAP20840.2 Protein CBG24171 [Caenorhabditis briggsae]
MAKTKVTAPQNTHVESKADIKKKIQLLGDEYITAIKDHQKASNDVRRIQSQQKESEILDISLALDVGILRGSDFSLSHGE